MVPQGATKGTKRKMSGRQKNLPTFHWFYELLSGLHFFYQDPAWDPKGKPKGRKLKMFDRRKTLITFLLKFMSSQQDLNFPTRIQDGCPSSTLNSKESFGIAKITEGFIVYRSLILGHFWWDLYRRRDVSFQPQSVGSRKEMCMFRRRPGRNISFRTITPSSK